MSASDANSFPRIQGEIIRDSLLKMFIFCLVLVFVVAPIGVGLLWAWWADIHFHSLHVSGLGAAVGGFLVLGGLAGIPLFVLSLFKRRQLVIGPDCIQMEQGDRVIDHIPYANIARTGLDEATVLGKFIGIDLLDLKHPGTRCPAAEITKNGFGWHCTLADEPWTIPLMEIHQRIAQRVQAAGNMTD